MGILLISEKMKMQMTVTSNEEFAVFMKYIYSKRRRTPVSTVILFAKNQAYKALQFC